MMKIKDVLLPRKEVIEGNFQGALQAHQVHSKTDRLESQPETLFNATFPSNGIRNVIHRCQQKLIGEDHQGGFLLAGPYGAGKTHALIVLYHLFNDPKIATTWLDEWHIDFDIPDTSKAVILSTSEIDADHLWEPIFKKLDREDLLDKVKRYPTIPIIEDLSDGKPLAIFFDEIETWYGSFSRDQEADLIEQNQMFLQNLLEVAKDPEQKVFTFITLLNKSDELKQILLRTTPIHEDLSTSGDREKLILHRLIETPRDEIDKDAVAEVAKKYVDHYEYPVEIKEPARYRQRIEETYPFHPQLISLMDRIYESAAERQNVRGAMNVLADVLAEYYDEVDLILTSQIDESAFRGINMELVHRFNYDANENEDTADILYRKKLLRTILLFTLDEKSRSATTSDILLGVFQPTEHSLNDLSMSLTDLIGRAHYLHRDDDNFMIREGLNLYALVEREARRMEKKEEAEKELFKIVRRAVFSGSVKIYEEVGEIDDKPNLDYVVSVSAPESNTALKEMLEEFFRGRRYQNTIIFITQEGPDILSEHEYVNKAKRIASALSLMSRIDDPEDELPALIRNERKDLETTLRNRFGRLIRWKLDRESDVLRLRQIPVQPSVADVREKIGTDRSYVADHIMEELEGAQGGRRVESLLNDFRSFRRLPVLLDDEVFYGAVRTLYQDNRIVIEGDKSKMFVPGYDAPPRRIGDELTLHHPSFIPESVLHPSDEGEKGDGNDDNGEDLGLEGGGGTTVVGRSTVEHIPVEGNSPSSVLSMIEARINQKKDKTRSIKITYSFEERLSKEETLDFIENIPSAGHIIVDLEVERDETED